MSTSDHQEQHDKTVEDDSGVDSINSPETGAEDGSDDDVSSSVVRPKGDPAPPEVILEADPAEYIIEEVENDDHRVARLRKLRTQFVGDGELSLTGGEMLTTDDTGPALIVCPNCDSEEVRGLRFCTQCNARLPNIVVVEQKFNPGSIDGAARKYFDAITKFHDATWSLEKFIEFLTAGLEKVRAHAEHLAELSEDGVIGEWLPEANDLIINATALWHDSVESMLDRIQDCIDEFEEEEALLEELDEEELLERDVLLPLEDRTRQIDFTPELESIFRANDQMLEYLRILDVSVKTEAKVGGMQF